MILPWWTMRSMTAAAMSPPTEHVAPSAGLEVRGEDDAAGLVAIRAGLEQEPGPVDVDGQVAELVDDGQPGPAYRLELGVQSVVVLGLPQAHDQAGGGEEPHGYHALACEHADRDGQVGLAAADVAVEHEVLGPVDEFQAFQLFAAPVGGERGHASGRSPPGSCSGGTRPVRAAAAVWIRPGSRSPSRTGWPGSRAGRAWRPPGPSRARCASTAGCAPRSHDLFGCGLVDHSAAALARLAVVCAHARPSMYLS